MNCINTNPSLQPARQQLLALAHQSEQDTTDEVDFVLD